MPCAADIMGAMVQPGDTARAMARASDIEALARDDESGVPEELAAFARIEGLMGQEQALLNIPAAKRTDREHRLLGAITAELDRIVEKLKERPVRSAVSTSR